MTLCVTNVRINIILKFMTCLASHGLCHFGSCAASFVLHMVCHIKRKKISFCWHN